MPHIIIDLDRRILHFTTHLFLVKIVSYVYVFVENA